MPRTFTFVPYGSHAPMSESASCDGLVPGASLDLTHWQRNRTPAELKADTSVEIALRAAERDAAPQHVLNNHFDTDGVLAVFALLEPEHALRQAGVLIAAAEAGDFEEWPADERGLRLDAAVHALAAGAEDELAYRRVLGALPRLLDELEGRDDLWGSGWASLRRDEARAEEQLEVQACGAIALFHHRDGGELAGPVLSRRAPADARRWLLAFEEGGGWRYRYELPRYAWADTVRRPRIDRPDGEALAQALGDGWSAAAGSGMTGLVGTPTPIALDPAHIVSQLRRIDPTESP